MNGYRDQYGVWNVVDKPAPRFDRFDAEVEAKVARSAGVNGWAKGPVYIIEQAQDEQIDTPAWLAGLLQYPQPSGLDARLERIHRKAAELWQDIEDLKGLYE